MAPWCHGGRVLSEVRGVMASRARPSLRRAALGRSPAGAEGAYSLVEMLVALAVLGIFAVMTATSVVAMNGDSVGSVRLGTAAESAQQSANSLARYLEDAVAPVDLSQGQLQLPGGCRNLSSAFVEASPAPSSGSEFSFCSYGVANSSGSPAVYSLDLCANGSPALTLTGPSGEVPISQERVVCSSAGSAGRVPVSYVAFCQTPPSLPASSAPPAGCSMTPPQGSSDPYLYLSLSVSANRSATASGEGAAAPTTITEVLNLPNLSGSL